MTERWTHNGQPVGQPQRPWRLTRAQRVEMEWAIALIRSKVTARPRRVDRLRDGDDVHDAAWMLVDYPEIYPDRPGRLWPWESEVRVARARVAIALRAALRADEDARREEADVWFCDDETETLREMCEWPAMRRRWKTARRHEKEIAALPLSVWSWANGSCDDSRRSRSVYAVRIDESIPLALWEVEERRRRETVRVLEALLTWGLS